MATHEHIQGAAAEQNGLAERPRLGMLIGDPAPRRLIEGIAQTLGVVPVSFEVREGSLTADRLSQFELIVADEPLAGRVRELFAEDRRGSEEITPGLVALVSSGRVATTESEQNDGFDAVLRLPQKPALLAAQLGIALYAHRASAKSYRSAAEELSWAREMFRSVPSGISVVDAQLPDMPLVYVNPAFELMTGYSLEEVKGLNCRFLQRGDREQPTLTPIRQAISEQRDTVAVIRNYRKDGSHFWNELVLCPIRNREGKLTHFAGIQVDVTDRVEFEIALRESEKLAAVGRLASAIAHEINNPLEAVMNLVYLAQHDLPAEAGNESARHYLKYADTELQRIKLIAAQSLRFYKQSQGPEAITCRDLLQSILDIYTPRFRNSNIEVLRRERSSGQVVCLASEIRQVLSNLVTNALDAMRGGGRLVVRTNELTNWRSRRRGVCITVADTGHGMSRETLDNIYKAFYTTKGNSGTGLGLWISSEIVRRHYGHLRVRSSQRKPRSGTIFQLFLPFQAAPGQEHA